MLDWAKANLLLDVIHKSIGVPEASGIAFMAKAALKDVASTPVRAAQQGPTSIPPAADVPADHVEATSSLSEPELPLEAPNVTRRV